ncbi:MULTISPECIES: bifunctional aspartate kinase/homoserine dehydrogenase I [Flavobacterium]|uniref:bifunctional aspartate kinase/homoserine dehydrogenase I n=1 Tax=Flavobacterium TaxID=237 RepID=UPI001FCC7D87|nr:MULTISPECIES: bifunctional aspartate kinase/homoserine dehydrogenase I [Flavobacterium]UOK42022.1 bifunctional aspartate kinase/homoserine dehydrogenase I [Flavobacterium enshiense]
MKVLKFGGTSVANAHNIIKVVALLEKYKERKVVVISALKGVTDALNEAINKSQSNNDEYEIILKELYQKHCDVVVQVIPEKNQGGILEKVESCFRQIDNLLKGSFYLGELSPKKKDFILAFGEILSSRIVYEKLKSEKQKVAYWDAQELIVTNSNFGNAEVNFELTDYSIQYYFERCQADIIIAPGFIAKDQNGNITTLGRGGSDYTAAIIAAALDADQLEIWTDVSGMYTANPKIVKQAKPIDHILYREAMELSHFGAKVLYAPTIQPVLNKNIPVQIKNTFEPEAIGTLIDNKKNDSRNPVKGISHIGDIALITVEGSGLIGVYGVSQRLFGAIAKEKINIILITQASSEHSICIAVSENDSLKAKAAIDEEFKYEIKQQKIKPSLVENNQCIIAVVGENMKNHQGLSGKIFSTLGKNNINIRAIAQGASERNISAVIDKKDVKKALNCLHEKFFEGNIKQLNLFIAGVGNVGSKFIEQIQQQKRYLKDNLKINIRVIAVCNSKTMVFDQDGIDLNNWENLLKRGEIACIDSFLSKVEVLNLRNSIFIDNTADNQIASIYQHFLKQNVAVVTCNKIACSSDYENYVQLKNLSLKYGAPFLFETNVGAGLPIINTLKNLIVSGDKVNKIQAVLSGSLNFIFNNFSADCSFHDVVKQAGNEGYTEPDPKIDLSGIDVMRKILILIRESGYQMEIDQIQNESFLPNEVLEAESINDFFKALEKNEIHFRNLFLEASLKNCRLKYVAEFENGKAKVGLQLIEKEHPFYNLEGKDNIVLFHTDRYAEQPLLIKGAGAGAAVTASGIFADVIRIANI